MVEPVPELPVVSVADVVVVPAVPVIDVSVLIAVPLVVDDGDDGVDDGVVLAPPLAEEPAAVSLVTVVSVVELVSVVFPPQPSMKPARASADTSEIAFFIISPSFDVDVSACDSRSVI